MRASAPSTPPTFPETQFPVGTLVRVFTSTGKELHYQTTAAKTPDGYYQLADEHGIVFVHERYLSEAA